MGPPLYMRSIIDRNVVTWRILALTYLMKGRLISNLFTITPYSCPITLCARS